MKKFKEIIAAPFTPFNSDGALNLSMIAPYAELLSKNCVNGVFVCGTTGEGILLTLQERKQILEEWIRVGRNKFEKIIAHVTCGASADSVELTRHAQEIGADGFSITSPSFFKPSKPSDLVAYCKQITDSVPDMPFYFYHIPGFTQLPFPMYDFLEQAEGAIPNLAGIKFTSPDVYDLGLSLHKSRGKKYKILNGQDENLLPGLSYGATGGVGGTFNYAAKLYVELINAYEAGDMKQALVWQNRSHDLVEILCKYRGNVICGKVIMKFLGLDLGSNRPPLAILAPEEENSLKAELETIGFFDYCNTI